jgi:hypothetical protein
LNGDGTNPGPASSPGTKQEEEARARAIKQIERRRHFKVEVVVSGIGMMILVVIWAVSEYHNAGGWPTHGFSQSSSIHDVWNYWIVYPLVAWVLIIAGRAWFVFGHRPISEQEIRQEIDRQARPR